MTDECAMCDLMHITCSSCRSKWEPKMLKYNIYTHTFSAKCPEDGAIIAYTLEIKTPETIIVSRITEYTDAIHEGIQEIIADGLHDAFGGEQKIIAWHQNVKIVSVRLSE